VSETVLVVPCYDEAARFESASFEDFLAADPSVGLVLVDDGSRDETRRLLETLARRFEGRAVVLALETNRGKAEAVRLGMLHAFDAEPTYVGFWDADLATPLDQVAEFRAKLAERPELLLVQGARVRLLGRPVRRGRARHFVDRLAAVAIAGVLRIPVYDTQCGAKLFRGGADAAALFAAPFLSRWLFDVELTARLVRRRGGPREAERAIYEVPLPAWRDVPGSKVRPLDYARSLFDLARIAVRYVGR
jgi:glycosyltransferase involved in cell wall biosynthesis